MTEPAPANEFVKHTTDPAGPLPADAITTPADQLLLFRMAQAELSLRVERIIDADWPRPTPCSGWTVADLVRHLIERQQEVPIRLSARADGSDERGSVGDSGDDDDLIAAFMGAATDASQALDVDGVLASALSDGTSVTDFLATMTVGLTVHSWDLTRALGENAQLPEPLAAAVWHRLSGAGDLTTGGAFAAPVEIDADASYTDRIVGLTGRDRYWAASPQ